VSDDAPAPSVASSLSQLLTLPNLGLNLFLALAFLLVATRGTPTLEIAVLILLAFFGARNAGHAFNQLVDRSLDARNPRTRGRPLVTGALSPRVAVAVVVASVALFLVAAYLIRPLLVLLALPALALVLGYSYTKRVTALTTGILGTVQALLPAGVYLAVDGTLPVDAWIAVGAMILFGTAFESVHSLGDVEADREAGLRSLPLKIGVPRAPFLVAGLLTGALALLLAYGLATVGPAVGLLATWVGMAVLAVWEVRALRLGSSPLLRIFRAHFAMGALFLLGVAVSYYVPLLATPL
jgi:4-hydroxybenzoate polyprenyltransferase